MSVTAKSVSKLTLDEAVAFGFTTTSTVLEGVLASSINFVAGNSAVSNGVEAYWTKSGTLAVTLAASGTVTYTLTALTDALSRTVTFAGGVRVFWVQVTSRTAGDFLTMGQAGTAPWTSMFVGTTPGIKIYKKLQIEVDLTDKYAVTAASNEQLKFTNSGTHPLTFEIGMAGCAT